MCVLGAFAMQCVLGDVCVCVCVCVCSERERHPQSQPPSKGVWGGGGGAEVMRYMNHAEDRDCFE